MTTFDFAPLFRTAIGFDRLARLMDTAASAAEVPSYPPYNIEKTGEDTYRLTMAVAGFRPDELDMVVKDNTLVVSGKVANSYFLAADNDGHIVRSIPKITKQY